MPTKTKGWSARRRAQQACNIRRAKIWARSTGPKTEEGKSAASKNATKHGLYAEDARRLARILKAHKNHIQKIFGQNPPWP